MKNQLFVVVVFMATTLSFSSASSQNTVKVTPDQVPQEFQNYQDTLLVVNEGGLMGYSKYLKKNFEKYYEGKYKIVSRNEYLNKPGNHFRFVFTGIANYELSGTDTHTLIQYILTDNNTGKEYKTAKTRYYSELMINYIKELNTQLKKQ